MSYTIWLLPNEEKTRAYLATTVADLARKYDGPVFEPHLTLFGDVQLPIDEIQKNCENLASQTKSLEVETGLVEYSTSYYQCVFVRVKPTPELMMLYETAKQIFGTISAPFFMPHMSLFYGNVPYSKRHEIASSITFKPQKFTIGSLVVTPGGEHPPSEWKHVLEIPLRLK